MPDPIPHYLLFCDSSVANPASNSSAPQRGHWRFTLENIEEQDRLEASDSEPETNADRIALTAVVRGLEAVPEASTITLVTNCKYVHRGLQYGIAEWREHEYCWEHFGTRQPVRNADLWRRIDRAMQFHTLRCRLVEQTNVDVSAEKSPEIFKSANRLSSRNRVNNNESLLTLAVSFWKRISQRSPNPQISFRLSQRKNLLRGLGWASRIAISLVWLIAAGPLQILINARASISFVLNETFGNSKSNSTRRIST